MPHWGANKSRSLRSLSRPDGRSRPREFAPLTRCGSGGVPRWGPQYAPPSGADAKKRARRHGYFLGWSRAPYPPRPLRLVSFLPPAVLSCRGGALRPAERAQGGFLWLVPYLPRHRPARPAVGWWVGRGLSGRAGRSLARLVCPTRCGAGWF